MEAEFARRFASLPANVRAEYIRVSKLPSGPERNAALRASPVHAEYLEMLARAKRVANYERHRANTETSAEANRVMASQARPASEAFTLPPPSFGWPPARQNHAANALARRKIINSLGTNPNQFMVFPRTGNLDGGRRSRRHRKKSRKTRRRH
jgi:hypothetical protein